MKDKTAIEELCWLYRAHQVSLPGAQELHGWLSSKAHRGRNRYDYCPFPCHLCAEQRIIDGIITPDDRAEIEETPYL